jgi:hypothetical protein
MHVPPKGTPYSQTDVFFLRAGMLTIQSPMIVGNRQSKPGTFFRHVREECEVIRVGERRIHVAID